MPKLEQLEAELFVAKQMGKKLERLQKRVVDTEAAALAAQSDAEAYAYFSAVADVAYAEAKYELEDYLEEQDDD